jgi:hypothetical protein
MAKPTDQDESLKRLGGGRWQTRDERFTIEPQSGTWVVVDAEQADELGLPLVRGPFGSLGAAKEAIAGARDAEPATSPLSERAAELRDRPDASTSAEKAREGDAKGPGKHAKPAPADQSAAPAGSDRGAKSADPQPAEPRWIQSLDPGERRRAKRLIEALAQAGAPDPEGIARRDIVGDVPAAAAFAIANALAKLGKDAPPAKVADLLAAGGDEDLGVRWRLVDGDDRPITIDLDAAEPR